MQVKTVPVFGITFLAILATTFSAWGRSHKPPAPLECLGSEVETHGHALILSPNIGHPITKSEKKSLALLARQDPIQLLQLGGIFKNADKTQIVDIRIDPEDTVSGFKSLKHFAKKKGFLAEVPLNMAAIVDKNDKNGIADARDLLKDLNNVDLRKMKSKIVSKWFSTDDESDDETAYFQLELKGKTVLTAIEFHDGAEDCLALDVQQHRAILPPGVNPKLIPPNYMFNLPIAPPFDVSYFFGPRIFNSYPSSKILEKTESNKPVALVRHSAKPLEYLNKYWHYHTGIDFAVMGGTPIYAPYDGLVFAMGPMGCAGQTLVLAHTISGTGDLIFSVYEHLMGLGGFAKVVTFHDKVVRVFRAGEKLAKGERTRRIQIGDPVFQGSLIAKSGASGRKLGFTRGFKEGCVDGAHLHFELRVPKEEAGETARDLTSTAQGKHKGDLGRRFRFVEFETTPINPADFIYGVDTACQARKNLEIQNAVALKTADKKSVPPMTAGLCSLKFEKSLKSIPTIYKLTRHKNDELQSQTEIARSPSAAAVPRQN